MFQLWTSGPQSQRRRLPRKREKLSQMWEVRAFFKEMQSQSDPEEGRRGQTSTIRECGQWFTVGRRKDFWSEGHAFVVTSLDAVRDGDELGRGKPMVDLDFGCTTWSALIDSGAYSNAMGKNEILHLQREWLEVGNLQHSSKRPYGYCKSRIFRKHFIFVYFVHRGFRTKIKCILKIQSKSENLQRSAAVQKFHAYERSGGPRIRKISAYEIFWIYSMVEQI